jgi:hypothetical protein
MKNQVITDDNDLEDKLTEVWEVWVKTSFDQCSAIGWNYWSGSENTRENIISIHTNSARIVSLVLGTRRRGHNFLYPYSLRLIMHRWWIYMRFSQQLEWKNNEKPTRKQSSIEYWFSIVIGRRFWGTGMYCYRPSEYSVKKCRLGFARYLPPNRGNLSNWERWDFKSHFKCKSTVYTVVWSQSMEFPPSALAWSADWCNLRSNSSVVSVWTTFMNDEPNISGRTRYHRRRMLSDMRLPDWRDLFCNSWIVPLWAGMDAGCTTYLKLMNVFPAGGIRKW